MELTSPISDLPKVGPALTKSLQQLGILTVQDLLYHFPYRYLDYRKTVTIDACSEGDVVTIRGFIKDIGARRSFKSRIALTEAIISDETGSIRVTWFNQPYLAKTLHKGEEIILSGKVDRYKTLQLANPVYERISEDTVHTGRLVPVYHSTEKVPNRTLRDIVHIVLPLADQLPDIVPPNVQTQLNILPLAQAVEILHFPTDPESVKRARFKIAFDDIFPQQIAMELQRIAREAQRTFAIAPDIDQVKSFLQSLPFEITASQKRASWDIFQDIATGKPMNRLLQGDVGSGKTLVALMAALQVGNHGLQTALLAPTEILARQHYHTIQDYLENYPHSIGLITRNFHIIDGKEVGKGQYLKALQEGAVHISIGTHAQIQEGIHFKNLALIVIDEQHRFGVAQRQFLQVTTKKTAAPHLLSMSATPIPRTLALSLYGNLEVSTLSQVPTGRKPIITKIVPDPARDQAYAFLKDQIKQGRQAFIITPRVEDTEKSEVRSAKKEFLRLTTEVFAKYKVGLLYGKMKGGEKDDIMNQFNNGELDILVATSVIEIGIDIPNATVMIIEGAERFGLAQLHQLRGRVGRGEHQSYCFLFTTEPTHMDNERLQIFSKTLNGFALAELDLQQRGFGDLFGKQQTGYAFRFPQFITIAALRAARTGAELLTKQDPLLKKHHDLKKAALRYIEELHGE